MDGLAVGHLAVGHAAVGLGVAELSFEQSATLLLFLLDVLKDGHWNLHSAQEPVASPGSICDPFGSNVLPSCYQKKS